MTRTEWATLAGRGVAAGLIAVAGLCALTVGLVSLGLMVGVMLRAARWAAGW